MMKPEIIVFKGDLISISDNLRGQEVDDSFVSLSSLRAFLGELQKERAKQFGHPGYHDDIEQLLQWLQQEVK